MILFDTDVFTEILLGNPDVLRRAAAESDQEQAIPVVVAEEILRGRLNAVRQAEAGKGRITLARAYELLVESIRDVQRLKVLLYTPQAETLFDQWRREGVRISTHDLRIAAISQGHSAKLVSRNRRDFDRVPGLDVEYWT